MPDTTAALTGDPGAVGPYRLERRLGTGGQGTVHVARGPSGQRVAIKLLHPHLVADERARGRFLGEVEIAKRVAPFCTAPVLDSGIDSGTDGDRPYIVSEFVDGPSLHASVRTSGPRSGAALHRLAVNTASALAAIHEAGVVHRDFKPGNVLLGPDGPVVIDFGIARALDLSQSLTTSQAVGSPAYMAPEQIANGEVGPSADLFAWAATLVFAATGRRAFKGGSIPGVMHAILHDDPDLPDLDPQLSDLVRACFAKDPADRLTAVAVLDSLRGPSRTAIVPSVPAADAPSAEAVDGPVPDAAGPAVTESDGNGPAVTESDANGPAVTESDANGPAVTSSDSADANVAVTSADESPVTSPGGGVVDRTRSARTRRRRAVLLTAGVALLVAAASTAAYVAGTAGHKGNGRGVASGPQGGMTSLPGGTAPTTSPIPSGTPDKTPSNGADMTSGPHSSGPPSGVHSQPSRKTSPPSQNGGGGSSHGGGTKTLGTVGKSDMDLYCNSKGQAYSLKQGSYYYCAVPSSIPVTWTDVCKWRYATRSSVYADGTTCKSGS